MEPTREANTRTALVTGASSGLGREFARQLGGLGYHVVLVARRADRLADLAEELRQAHGDLPEILPADLTDLEQLAIVEARLADSDHPVELLVNNAGIALRPRFHTGTVAGEQRMLALNVTAVMRLTHAVLPGMVARGRGGVLNVSSVAGFGAVSAGSTYSATKAWVTNFSQSCFAAVRRHGVAVVALCPGFVHTEFHASAGLREGPSRSPWWLSADRVVRAGLRAVGATGKRPRARRPVVIPTLRYRLVVGLIRYVPAALLRLVARRRGGL